VDDDVPFVGQRDQALPTGSDRGQYFDQLDPQAFDDKLVFHLRNATLAPIWVEDAQW
jgi:hypothetical protein